MLRVQPEGTRRDLPGRHPAVAHVGRRDAPEAGAPAIAPLPRCPLRSEAG